MTDDCRRVPRTSKSLPIVLRRFGPIRNADFDVKPLTLFIGGNGTGKSYAASLLHVLSEDPGLYGVFGIQNRLRWESSHELPEGASADLMWSAISKAVADGESKVPPSVVSWVVQDLLTSELEERISRRLATVFAANPGSLVQFGRQNWRLEMADRWGIRKFVCNRSGNVKGSYEPNQLPIVTLRVTPSPVPQGRWQISPEGNITIVMRLSARLRHILSRERGDIADRSTTWEAIAAIQHACMSTLDVPPLIESHYLPAGRSGLLQSHNVLSINAIERLAMVGVEPISVPAFSGTIAEFLREIIEMTQRDPGPLANLAKAFESRTLRGSVLLRRSKESLRPQILFSQGGQDLPLTRASTSVSELAPLILLLRYSVAPGELLIIEEPEAHLHPENQRHVAELVAQLLHAKVRVVITTHSDFFLEQVNNSIRASRVVPAADKKAAKPVKPTTTPINPDDVSCHLFKRKTDGTIVVDRIDIGADGISMTEFERIRTELFEETLWIEKMAEPEEAE